MKTLLAEEAIEFLEAWDGAGAYRVAQQTHLDLIIADLNMPNLDGIGLLRLLRTDQRLRSIPVVLFTGDKDAALRARAVEAGATAFLNKPVSPEGVNQVLELVRRPRATRTSARAAAASPNEAPTVAPPRR